MKKEQQDNIWGPAKFNREMKSLGELTSSFGLPRLIITGFLVLLFILAPVAGVDFFTQITNVVNRFSWNAVMVLAMVSVASAEDAMRVAMITDYGDITDQSFNQTTYEACKKWAEENGVDFTYFKPAGDSTPERVAMVEKAAEEGYNVIVMPGYAFGGTIAEVQNDYSDIKFVALDVSEGDLGGVELASNVYCAVYQEELCGYMAGYAAVKLGYTHLGFLGGMAVPAVVRYGYGFVQGCNAAAVEMGKEKEVTVEYVYGNQFFGDADITAYMDNWYQTRGVQAVFACGGGIYTSAAEAAAKVNAKVIGVDVDQAGIINAYGEGMTVTSAMKGLAATVNTLLTEIKAGNFASFGGKVETLGLVSGTDMDANYVGIPASTQYAEGFTAEDYAALVAKMFAGEVTVSNDTETPPEVALTVTYYGNIK